MSGPASDAGTIRREALVRNPESGSTKRALSRARLETSRFLLDFDLHGSRQVGQVNRETLKSPRRASFVPLAKSGAYAPMPTRHSKWLTHVCQEPSTSHLALRHPSDCEAVLKSWVVAAACP